MLTIVILFLQKGKMAQTKWFITKLSPEKAFSLAFSMISFKYIVHYYYYRLKTQYGSTTTSVE